MITLGGAKYRWQGRDLRRIEGCVVLSKSTSQITCNLGSIPTGYYKVTIGGSYKGSGAKLEVDINGETNHCKINSKTKKDYSFITYVEADDKHTVLRVYRSGKSGGSVFINTVSLEETVEPPTPKPQTKLTQAKKNEGAKRRREQKRKQLAEIQSVRAKEEREREEQRRLVSEGIIMGASKKVGGQGYKWRGKHIQTRYMFGSTCAVMNKSQSMITIPASVHREARYKVSIRAAAEKGSGKLIVNFFGGLKADGQQVQVDVANDSLKTYDIYLKTPNFPPNLPMQLRVFRPNGDRNKIYVQSVEYQQVKDVKSAVRKRSAPPRPPKVKPQPGARGKRKPKVSGAVKSRNKDRLLMRYKPYNISSINREKLEKVLITDATDVPKVSIITPTRDGAELLKNCYTALNTNTAYPNWEWIVGDSESQDDTVQFIKGLGDSRIKLVQRGTTDGSFSTINNELVQHSDGDYLVFLNNDTRPKNFWLYEMMTKIYNRPNVGVVGAQLLYNDKKIQHAGIAFIPEGPANIGKDLLKILPKGFHRQDRELHAVTGACFLMRREDFDQLDGFDPAYYFCYEDVDLCLRTKQELKKRVVYAAGAKIYHDESVTQKKHKTGGVAQKRGIEYFKNKWMGTIKPDVGTLKAKPKQSEMPIHVSFVTCINDLQQYNNYVVGSLFKNKTKYNYEIVPIFNFKNQYSAAQALNLGIAEARGNIVVLCHQDVVFYEGWIDLLMKRIDEINKIDKKWGVLGTAGISKRDATIGVVHNMKGKIQWRSTVKRTFYPVQTVDEHCMVIRKKSGLKFDEQALPGFHFYGVDLALQALARNMKNYGILCPLVHDSKSMSLMSGRKEFMRQLNVIAKKWGKKFQTIRTPTSLINRGSVRTFVNFKRN